MKANKFVLAYLLASSVALLSATDVNADPKIEKTSLKGELKWVGAGKKWVETIVFKNTGNMAATDYFVTSQPYNGKKAQYGLNPDKTPKPGANVAVKQNKKITIPAGESKTVVFEFTGTEAQKWETWYADVYSKEPFTLENREYGGISTYALAPIPPGMGGTFFASFFFPYPDALSLSSLGPTTFSLDITDTFLSWGWSFASLAPLDFFVLDYGQSELITATFTTPPMISAGETGFVNFEVVPEGALGPDIHYRSSLGVVAVPEPTSLLLLGSGLVGLMGFRRKRPQPA